jgi:hypothetical protein
MIHLKVFSNKSAAIGKKIPSPCVVKYVQENTVVYFRPAGSQIVTDEIYTIQSNGTAN